jgi:hypothetical protein
MIKRLPLIMAMILCGAYPLMAQRPEEQHPAPQAQPHGQNPPKANNGHIPPPPQRRASEPARPQGNAPENRTENRPPNQPENRTQNMPENRNDNRSAGRQETRQENVRPHVENDQWVGHDTNDQRYRISHPYEHGHFEHFGQQYRYGVQRVDRDHHEFWFPGGFYFQVADWDWLIAADWCWNCGDNFVVYEDPDHPGWYLVYDTETGEYVHAQYMGG